MKSLLARSYRSHRAYFPCSPPLQRIYEQKNKYSYRMDRGASKLLYLMSDHRDRWYTKSVYLGMWRSGIRTEDGGRKENGGRTRDEDERRRRKRDERRATDNGQRATSNEQRTHRVPTYEPRLSNYIAQFMQANACGMESSRVDCRTRRRKLREEVVSRFAKSERRHSSEKTAQCPKHACSALRKYLQCYGV